MIIFYSRQYLVQFHRAYLLPFGVGMLLLRRSHPSGKQPWGTAGLESTQVAQPGRPTRSSVVTPRQEILQVQTIVLLFI